MSADNYEVSALDAPDSQVAIWNVRARLVATLVLLWCCASPADDMRWIGIGDTHYGTTWTWTGGNSTTNFLHYCETNFHPSFFILAGDVGETRASSAMGCQSNNYPAYTQDVAVLTVPIYQTAGNHDLVQWAGTYGNFNCYTQYFSRDVAFTNGNYVFIGLPAYDSSDGTSTNGAIHDADIDFMESVLSNSVPLYTNFITYEHYPLILDSATAPFGRLGLGYGRYTNLLNKYHVVMNLHGHTHTVDALSEIVPNTLTPDRLCPSPTRSGQGMYDVFFLTNTTLTTVRYRWDTGGVLASWTNTVPAYVRSAPYSAATLNLTPGSSQGNGPILLVSGEPGAQYTVQYATDLANGTAWYPLTNITLSGPTASISLANTNPAIFYRLKN